MRGGSRTRGRALGVALAVAAVGTAAVAEPLRPADLFGPGAPGASLPEEDAVVLLAADTFVLHPDGRIDHGTHRLVRLQSDFAIDVFGDPRVPYDSLHQEVVIHACRTYAPDGRVVDARPHAFNRTTPDAAAACPDAMRRQELVVSYLGVERGCVIEIDLEVRDRVPRAPWLEGLVFAAEDHPVVQRVVTVKCPAGVALWGAAPGGLLTEEVAEGRYDGEGGGAARIHVWRGRDVPPAREADDGAGGRRTRAHLVFSTCPSWDALAARVRSDIEAAAQAPPGSTVLRDWLDDREREARTLTADDRVAAILRLTGTGVASASIAPFEAYRAARPATRTFETARGDDWDRAALALALLRGIGLAPEIALRPASPVPAREVPALAQFDRVLLRAGPDRVLDPSGGKRFARPEGWGGQPLFLAGTGGEAARWWDAGPAGGSADVAVALTIEDDGAFEGEAELDLTGRLFPYEDMADLESFLSGYAGRLLPGAEVRGREILELSPAVARLRFSFGGKLEAERDRRVRLALSGGPVGIAGVLESFNLRRPSRTTAVVLPGPLRESAVWKIAMPESWRASFLPAAQLVGTEAGEFRLEVDPPAPGSGSGRGAAPLRVAWTLSLPASEVPPAAYGALRRIHAAYASEAARQVILAR
jgi:hypothetical protein